MAACLPKRRRYARPLVLRRLDLRGHGLDLRGRLPRPAAGGAAPLEAVQQILADVRERGDDAVRDLTERFDGCRIDDPHVSLEECRAALERVDPALRKALEVAAANVRAYHEAQVPAEAAGYGGDGMVVQELRRPVDRAGCYAPGGRASYPSTVLMTVIPAKVAGVPEVVLTVPPRKDGTLPDEVLAAAAVAGADEVLRIGGAQAIGALAHGTGLVRPVDVIVGPGNVYVALAKREVAGLVGIPSSFAGPSEVVVVADASAPVEFAAVDVVLQAEHGPDGLAWLVTWDEQVADDVTAAISRIVEASPRRADVEATLQEGGYAVVCDGPEQALAVANEVAPEHLELIVENPEALLPLVRHAGAVFCGPWAPASMGDYAAGPNHVLPTFGSARFSEALRVDDFVKHIHVVTLERSGFDRLAEHVVALADAEGLDAHAQSIRLRQGWGAGGSTS
jgi:histidinol dehydrogenase